MDVLLIREARAFRGRDIRKISLTENEEGRKICDEVCGRNIRKISLIEYEEGCKTCDEVCRAADLLLIREA